MGCLTPAFTRCLQATIFYIACLIDIDIVCVAIHQVASYRSARLEISATHQTSNTDLVDISVLVSIMFAGDNPKRLYYTIKCIDRPNIFRT